jgi:hypothetical protein
MMRAVSPILQTERHISPYFMGVVRDLLDFSAILRSLP